MQKPAWGGRSLPDEGWAWIVAVAVGFAARWIWGFKFGVVNNEFHIPILLMAREHMDYQGDALASTLGNFASPLWGLLSRFPATWDVGRILEGAFLLSRILLAWSAGVLAGSFVPEGIRLRVRLVGSASTLAAGWILNLPLGADPVMGTYFSQTFLSAGLLAGALGMGFSGRGYAAAVLLGLGYDVNLMQANFAAGILLPVWILSGPMDRKGLAALVAKLSVVALVSSPGLFAAVQVMAAGQARPVLAGKALADFAAFHIPGHFFWGMKSTTSQFQALGLLGIPLVAALVPPRRSRTVLAAGWVLVGYFLAQIVLLRIAPSRFLFQLHLFRSDVLCYALATCLCVAGAVESLQAGRRRDLALWSGATLLLLSGNFPSALALLVARFLRDSFRGWRGVAPACTVVVATLVAEVLAGFSGTAIALSLLAFGSLLELPLREPWERAPALLASASLLGLVVSSARTCWIDVRGAASGASAQFTANYNRTLETARNLSPEDALFAVPPSMNSRPVLQRAVYWNIWDGAGFLWSKGHEVEVLSRMANSGVAYTPGVQYVGSTIDRQWSSSLCGNARNLAKAGVTWVVAPATGGRIAPSAGTFEAFPIDSLLEGSACIDGGAPAGGADGR